MKSEILPESAYADGIGEIIKRIKEDTSKYTANWIAGKLNINASALTHAKDRNDTSKKFGKMTRKELLEKIENIQEVHFRCQIDANASKIIVLPTIGKTKVGSSEDRQFIYKVCYWRGGDTDIGIGVMTISVNKVANQEEWHQATLLIDNQYANFKNEDPYVMHSTQINQYEKNTFIDFIDADHGSHRQLAVFRTLSPDVKNRKLIEGVFATITRDGYKPVAGMMLMDLLSTPEKESYLQAEAQDGDTTFEHRRVFFKTIHAVQPVIYNALYRKRLDTKGHNLVSVNSLPNFTSWDALQPFVGVYEGHYVRTSKKAIECFLVEFHENGSAILYFPKDRPGAIRFKAKGHFKWVSVPKHLLTANFEYDPNEDHWRFRFVMDSEEENSCLYGIFAGTEVNVGDPVSGRVRLRRINETMFSEGQTDEDKEQAKKKYSIESYTNRLRRIKLNSTDYTKLIQDDIDLELFLSGQHRPYYTVDSFHELPKIEQPEKPSPNSDVRTASTFRYAGDYELYTLYRTLIGNTQKYYILRHPVRIRNDRSVEIRIRDNQLIKGVAIYSSPVLKINFDEVETAYSHMLFTVNSLGYDMIDHVYGVLTGVHIVNHRSEATIAVLVGRHSVKEALKVNREKKGTVKPRPVNFDENTYYEYEVGKADFFQLDSGDPARIATFISGHFNRYISPPSHPNMSMQSRLSKYRMPYFKAACYAGLNYIRATKQNSSDEKANEQFLCIEALEEAFQHGFCDPIPQQDRAVSDRPLPKEDIDLLVKEILPGGSMVDLVDDVLKVCDDWNRIEVRKVYERKRPDPKLDFK